MKRKNEHGFDRTRSAHLLTTAALLLVGVAALIFGVRASSPPWQMLGILHSGIVTLLLLNLLWPVLTSGLQNALATPPETKENARALRRLLAVLGRVARAIGKSFLRWSGLIWLVLSLAILGTTGFFLVRTGVAALPESRFTYFHLLLLAASFAVLLVLSKVLKHFATDAELRRSLTSLLDVLRFNVLAVTVCAAVDVVGLFKTAAVLRVAEWIVAVYCLVFLLASLVNGFLRKEYATGALLVIPRPFSRKNGEEEDLLTYLERSTGITLRSLYGIRVAARLIPAVLLGVVVCFWLSTGITQIEPYQHGMLYRFGRCERVLDAGIHFTLPYPLDKVEVYETEKVQEMVVGYEHTAQTDLLWTESHGGTEYKLLLGDGNELVSVNIRIKYKIDDLAEYVTCSAEPEQILNATAYSLITDLTVTTTLDDILAEDRALLSQNIEEGLAAYLDTAACGLAVCDVIIESIHPPVEVSEIYQGVVNAELEREATLSDAEGLSEAKIIYARQDANSEIESANARQHEEVAAAIAAVAEFMAMAEAYEEFPDAFCYYKYLETLSQVYEGKRLYIVGDGIDSSYLYFGDGVVIYNKGK